MEWDQKTFWFALLYLIVSTEAIHLRGSWRTTDFFKFLDRFGFQQTDLHDKSNTQGYIYGNITTRDNLTSTVTLVVVDSAYFLQYYGNRSITPKSEACSAMFKKIDPIAWDPVCNSEGQEDFLRRVPCPKNGLCIEGSDVKDWIIPGFQFTYQIQDLGSPRFWYISLVSCHHNNATKPSCSWTHDTQQDIVIDYDIWLVNGHPFVKHINPFEHQFSFEHHDIFEIYLAFFIVYSLLVPVQFYALSRQKHMLPLLLTTCMTMEYVGIIFNLIHVLKFAFDGDGVDMLKVVGNFIDNVAQCIFMLLLLLIVKGWTITRMTLSFCTKVILFTIWGTYTVANMALFVWNLTEVDLISDTDEWQTWPGYLILGFRLAIMVWFLLELRKIFVLETGQEKTRFYLHFGAGFLVWFVYLPIAAVICNHVSALWRYKSLLSVQYSADFLSFCVMVHLLWPTRSYLYFNLKVETRIPMEDLEFAGLGTTDESVSEDSIEIPETSSLMQRQNLKMPANGHLRKPGPKDCNTMEEAENLITMQAILDTENALDETETSFTTPLLNHEDFTAVGQNDNSVLEGSRELKPKQKMDNGDSGIESVAGLNGDLESQLIF